MYYPPGWQIYIDEKPVENIYKTDHAIQSIVVPHGEHKVSLRFEPESYVKNVSYAMGSLSLVYLVIIGSLIQIFLKKKNENNE
jgi:uncharacterized membrane protein YfhO